MPLLRFIRKRPDKQPEEATTSQDVREGRTDNFLPLSRQSHQIAAMYEAQMQSGGPLRHRKDKGEAPDGGEVGEAAEQDDDNDGEKDLEPHDEASGDENANAKAGHQIDADEDVEMDAA